MRKKDKFLFILQNYFSVPPDAPTVTSTLTTGLTVAATGTDLTFTCMSAESGVTYKWFKDTTEVTGQTASTYALTSLTSSVAGSYTCTVSNSAGESPASGAVAFTTQGQDMCLSFEFYIDDIFKMR